jgi:hypothetical protein
VDERCHWDLAVGCGDQRIPHDENGEIWVPREHVGPLSRAGYIVINE